MNEARWEELVARWEERDRRWEQRDGWWKDFAERWERRDREHTEFMREMWRRMEEMDIRQQAAHEHVIARIDVGTEAIMKVLDRWGEGPLASS